MCRNKISFLIRRRDFQSNYFDKLTYFYIIQQRYDMKTID